MSVKPFWIEYPYDRDAASGGTSRFGVYLGQEAARLREGDWTPARFAAEMWRIATPPVMTPGFVQWHPRILTATCSISNWDGSLVGHVTAAAPDPAEMARVRGFRGWTRSQRIDGREGWQVPSDEVLARQRTAVTSTTVFVPVPDHRLHPRHFPDGRMDGKVSLSSAMAAVQAVVKVFNENLDPILRAFDGGNVG